MSIDMDTIKISYNDGADSDIDIGSNISIDSEDEKANIMTYPDISIGDGKHYQIDLDKTDPKDAKHLSYPYTQKLIQIFIELRDSLGYTSNPPHTYSFSDISEAIKTLQIEYAKEYNILFSYGYKIIKADVLNQNNNYRTVIVLFKERDKAYGIKKKPVTNIPIPVKPTLVLKTNSPISAPSINKKTEDKNKLDLSHLNGRRFGAGTLNSIYTPKPQREPRKRDRLFVPEDAKPVIEASRIYGNSQVTRRRKSPRIPIIVDPEY